MRDNLQHHVDSLTWLYSVGSGRGDIDAAAGPTVIDAWCAIKAQLTDSILLEVASAVREASEEATVELRAAAIEFRKLRTQDVFPGAHQNVPIGRSPRRCADVVSFGDAHQEPPCIKGDEQPVTDTEISPQLKADEQQLAVVTESSEANKVSEGLELVSPACGVEPWEDFPSGWNTQMIDSIVEELMCQDLHCGVDNLGAAQACNTEQLDGPTDIGRMDLQCISIDNQLDNQIGTSVLDKSDSPYHLPTSKASLETPAGSRIEDNLDITQACDKELPPISLDNHVMEIPIYTSVMDATDPLPTLDTSVETPVASMTEDYVLSTPRRGPKDIPHSSPDQVLEAKGGSIDFAVANSLPQSSTSGAIELAVASSLPLGSTSGSIDLAVANSLPQGSTSVGIDIAVANSLPQCSSSGGTDLAAAESVPKGAVHMQAFSVGHPNTDARQLASSAQTVQDRLCRSWEAVKSARFPTSMQRCTPGVVTYSIGSNTPPYSGSGSGGLRTTMSPRVRDSVSHTPPYSPSGSGGLRPTMSPRVHDAVSPVLPVSRPPPYSGSGSGGLRSMMSPRVRDAVSRFEQHVKRKTPGAVSHSAVVRPNFLVGGMRGRMSISPGLGVEPGPR